jgi:WD40 repeat protein
MAWSPDGTDIACASDDGSARVWDAETGRKLLALRGQTQRVHCVTYSPDGKRIATAAEDGAARVWDASDGTELMVLRERRGSNVVYVTYCSDGRRIATVAADDLSEIGIVRVWDAENGAAVLQVRGGVFPGPGCVALSPDGQRIAIASLDGSVCVLDVRTRERLAVLRGHERPFLEITFSADGQRIVSRSLVEGTVRVWNARTGECLEVLTGEADIEAVAAGIAKYPLRAVARHGETVIEQAADGKPVAWFPIALGHIITHPSGRTWAGAAANHLYLISVVGISKPASQKGTQTP